MPEPNDHPAFVRARALPEDIGALFPKSVEEAQVWMPRMYFRALSSRVLVVAKTRIECRWSAYCDAVPGMNHALELAPVVDYGAKLPEELARVLFPRFADVPYAD